MTAIVAVKHNGHVWMGGDSAFISGWDVEAIPDEKVFFVGEILFGVAGSPRTVGLLRYHLKFPDPQTDDLREYITTSLVDALRGLFNEKGHATKSDEQEQFPSAILVSYGGRLFMIDSDYQVLEIPDYTAIGSGGTVALGALAATVGKSPAKRVQIALEAAAKHNIAVRGPFQVVKQ